MAHAGRDSRRQAFPCYFIANMSPAPDFAQLPPVLQQEVAAHWQHYNERCAQAGLAPADDPRCLRELPHVWACSPFVARQCQQTPALLRELLTDGMLYCSADSDYFPGRLMSLCGEADDESALMAALRFNRRREMIRIAWRDLAGLAPLGETMADLSALADASLSVALDWLHADLVRRHGEPRDAHDQPQRLAVIAMGKLGGCELNFSSDIDLMFLFSGPGQTRGGGRPLSSEEFFNRLGKRLIKTLNETTGDGFVFRVDMRLRPFGDSGPLVQSLGAMESYYETHARDWERYALIKARCCAGDLTLGESLLSDLQPFVYRRYIDYSVLDSLRNMKKMIDREVQRKDMRGNIKLGRGGIREIEFIGQMFQLVRGGKEPALRSRRILDVLAALQRLRLLPESAVADMRQAYCFLRNTEHRLQQIDDRQTQTLPENDLDRLRVALGMGHADWPGFLGELDAWRERVDGHFSELLRQDNDTTDDTGALQAVWASELDSDQATELLCAAGFTQAGPVLEQLRRLRHSRQLKHLSGTARERLDRLMPMLLKLVLEDQHADSTLEHILPLIETIARRSVYLAMLAENPAALRLLVRLFSASAWVATQITRHPLLLDELLDPRSLFDPPSRGELLNDLNARLYKCERGDLEQYMDSLRHFKNAQVLRVAAADIAGSLPLAEVSNHLSAIAETVLRKSLDLAWDFLSDRHGPPLDKDGRPAGFGIIAYGKLGGLELGYGSDLDIVFLHDGQDGGGHTGGPKVLDNSTFFNRLARRIIHLLTTVTPAGTCYDIDTRLRPNGASGLLVSSLDAYARYQRQDAWTWEHQALVRARPVAGDGDVTGAFASIRREILAQRRDADGLRRDIIDMRARMRAELEHKEAGVFDLKQGLGGIADIEFMVQYAVLRWASEEPALLEFTDNLRLLETLAGSGLLPQADCLSLRQAYFDYRAAGHRLALQGQPARVTDNDRFHEHRVAVRRIWEALLGNS